LRDYSRVHAPILAIYADSEGDRHLANGRLREEEFRWERKYWRPFRAKSMRGLREAPTHVEIVSVSGSHMNFFLVSREKVVDDMRRFLLGTSLTH
jgi:hypothetical protein